MAEISTDKRNSKGVTTSKKLSTRVDLTPMVDLGFLLITFFIFTTTITSPNVVKLTLPDDSTNDSSITPEGKTLTLILDSNNRVYYYKGFLSSGLQSTSYRPADLRNLLITTMDEVAKKYGNRQETAILIKPTAGANYSNVVNVLDEMLINGVSRYILMDVNDEEMKHLKPL